MILFLKKLIDYFLQHLKSKLKLEILNLFPNTSGKAKVKIY